MKSKKIITGLIVLSFIITSFLEAADTFVPGAKIKTEISEANPHWSGFFSILFPGAGHYYQGRWGKGALFTFTEGTFLMSSVALYVDAAHDEGRKKTNKQMIANNMLNLFQNEHFYNIYSSYQDARLTIKNQGFKTLIAKDFLGDLLTAPVDSSILTRWTFLIPTSLVAGLAAAVIWLEDRVHVKTPRLINSLFLLGAQSTVIGVGEESLFRGYIQPEFTELYGGHEWPAIFTQAALFGAAHISGDGWFQPVFTGVSGIYDGWIAKRNSYSLKENVAQHAWWDFILLSTLFIVKGKSSDFILSFPAFRF